MSRNRDRVALVGLVVALACRTDAPDPPSEEVEAQPHVHALEPEPVVPAPAEPSSKEEDAVVAIARDVEGLFAVLPRELERLRDMDELARWCEGAKLVSGVAEAARNPGTAQMATITLAEPIATARVIELLGLSKPRGVSGDVHQRTWSVALETGELKDPHNRRIATTFPRYGAWELILQLDGRPPGPAPAIVAGASSAYDLTTVPTQITHLEVWHRP